MFEHGESVLHAVDLWEAPERDMYHARALDNITEAGLDERVMVHRMASDAFFAVNGLRFDLCYVDGAHDYAQAKRDIGSAMQCTKRDGLVLVDDCYSDVGWRHYSPQYREVLQAMTEATNGAFVRRGNAAVWHGAEPGRDATMIMNLKVELSEAEALSLHELCILEPGRCTAVLAQLTEWMEARRTHYRIAKGLEEERVIEVASKPVVVARKPRPRTTPYASMYSARKVKGDSG